MEDLDDLFDEQLGETLNDLSNEQLDEQLNGHLGGHLDIPAPLPPPHGLAERIDELRLSGCVDKISWSKNGTIAYITKDSRSVRITNLRFRRSDGTWIRNDYADPILTEAITKIYKGRQIVHLAWNTVQGTELVVSDAHGRLIVFSTMFTFVTNKLQALAVLSIDPEDSLNATVGMTWLTVKRPVPTCRSAQKVEGNWKYIAGSNEPRGPFAPSNRPCFMVVTRGGLLRLCSQVASPQAVNFQEQRKDLDGFSTSGDLVTHASFSSDKDDIMLLAVHTHRRQLRLYSLKIDFHIKQGEQVALNPSIELQHLAMIDASCPSVETPLSPLMHAPELTNLTIIPRTLDQREPTNPCILATFTSLPRGILNVNSGIMGHSIFSRWELKEETPVLDASFAKLGSKKSGVSELKAQQSLSRLEDVKLDRVVLSVHLLTNGTLIASGSPDGSIEIRTRNLLSIPLDEAPDRVTGLTQLGFYFNNREPCLHIALSPSSSVRATMGKECELKTSSIELNSAFIDTGGPATTDKLAAAFVMVNTVAETSSAQNNTNDDLILTMQTLLKQFNLTQAETFKNTFLKDFCTIFGFQERLIEGFANIDKTIRNPMTARCLSLQAALSDHGEVLNRTLTSKVAYTSLSLRNFAISFSLAFGRSGTDSDLNKPDVLLYLTDLIAWFGTLADHICDQLLDLSRTLDREGFSFQALKDRVNTLNSPILHLVLSSFTRSLLRNNCRALRSIAPLTKSPQAQQSSPLHSHYANLVHIFRANLISPPVFETLLTHCDEIIRRACEGLTKEQKQQTELALLLTGDIPDVLQPAIREILDSAVEKIRTQNHDPMRVESDLAFKDWKTLGLLDDKRSKMWRKETRWDGMRKIELPKDVRTRRCMRCEALMEDMNTARLQRGGQMFIQMFRTCFCGGHWLVDPPPVKT